MFTTDATNLPRVMNCNGSRNMPPSFPAIDIDPTARDEGNAAHWAAQEWFNGRDPMTLIDVKAPSGFIVTGEMLDHVRSYLFALECGQMEAVTTFHGETWTVNARCDHYCWNASTLTLTVDDFKFGRSLVEVENNWTLLAHAIGLCINSQITPQTIVLRIHQPRAYHPDGPLREWRLTYSELLAYHSTIDTTLSNLTDELRTNLSWCRRCHALATCPAARAARMNIVDATATTFTDELPDAALAYELATIETARAMLEAQYDALKELTIHRLRGGAVIENYAIEPQYANSRFLSGLTPEFLTIATGINCIKASTITPAEFKRRGGSELSLKGLTERPLIGSKLVRVSANKRAEKLLGKKG